jgi:hypothetical protein
MGMPRASIPEKMESHPPNTEEDDHPHEDKKQKDRSRLREHREQKTVDEHWEMPITTDLALELKDDYNAIKVQAQLIGSIPLPPPEEVRRCAG